MARNEDSFLIDDYEKISDFTAKVSTNMYKYIQDHQNSRFVLFYKYLTHSDLATFGKSTKPGKLEDNLLYYLNESEMVAIEDKTSKPFQTAHQSCIGLKKEFYDKTGIPNPRDVPPYSLTEYMNVFLVNDNLEYFTSKYTKKIFAVTNKKWSNKQGTWDFENLDVKLDEGLFTPIVIHVAVHGLGTKDDINFHKLRHHMFKGDTFMLLFEQDGTDKNLFVMLEKNPVFFSLIGESNKAYEEYQKQTRERLVRMIKNKGNALPTVTTNSNAIENEVTRQQQAAWRKMLANEMMGYTQENNQVFCPFTYITANFDSLGSLFVASHIKGFSDPNIRDEEKYDVNNGLLLCANADALFDKHLISIDENKQLVFSFLLDNDIRLKQQLLLLQPIFQPILNEKRMAFLKYHKEIFDKCELDRRTM